MKRIGLIVAGWASLLLGVAGLFLPVIQGWFFILVGLLLLSSEYIWAHRLLQRLLAKFPRLKSAFLSASKKVNGWTGTQPLFAALAGIAGTVAESSIT
jgi:uncharacterized membrane protein YbaN (DUF454 family)